MRYSVYTEDGAHADKVDDFDTMFDALCCYYESINEGPGGYWGDQQLEGIELAQECLDDGDEFIESIDYHEF